MLSDRRDEISSRLIRSLILLLADDGVEIDKVAGFLSSLPSYRFRQAIKTTRDQNRNWVARRGIANSTSVAKLGFIKWAIESRRLRGMASIGTDPRSERTVLLSVAGASVGIPPILQTVVRHVSRVELPIAWTLLRVELEDREGRQAIAHTSLEGYSPFPVHSVAINDYLCEPCVANNDTLSLGDWVTQGPEDYKRGLERFREMEEMLDDCQRFY